MNFLHRIHAFIFYVLGMGGAQTGHLHSQRNAFDNDSGRTRLW